MTFYNRDQEVSKEKKDTIRKARKGSSLASEKPLGKPFARRRRKKKSTSPKETIEQFLARGGQITKAPKPEDPGASPQQVKPRGYTFDLYRYMVVLSMSTKK